jgi:hypothetical protein
MTFWSGIGLFVLVSSLIAVAGVIASRWWPTDWQKSQRNDEGGRVR